MKVESTCINCMSFVLGFFTLCGKLPLPLMNLEVVNLVCACVCLPCFYLCPFQLNQRMHLLSIRNAGAYEQMVIGSVTKTVFTCILRNGQFKNKKHRKLAEF